MHIINLTDTNSNMHLICPKKNQWKLLEIISHQQLCAITVDQLLTEIEYEQLARILQFSKRLFLREEKTVLAMGYFEVWNTNSGEFLPPVNWNKITKKYFWTLYEGNSQTGRPRVKWEVDFEIQMIVKGLSGNIAPMFSHLRALGTRLLLMKGNRHAWNISPIERQADSSLA